MYRPTVPARLVLPAACLAAGAGLALTASAAVGGAPDLPGRTIVGVEGDADHGFTIHHLDGTSQHPPTLSETTAECEEYDDAVDVAVCVAEVRTWFRDLADLQLSLRWALAQD